MNRWFSKLVFYNIYFCRVVIHNIYGSIDINILSYYFSKLVFKVTALFVWSFAAPPTFIGRLQPYMGVLTTAKAVSLSCHVECFPLCEILWLKNGIPIVESEFYNIKTNTLPPDQTKSDFESVLSTLSWNLTAWPNGQLDRLHDNANYTCQSTHNKVGSGVSSTTHLHVECK